MINPEPELNVEAELDFEAETNNILWHSVDYHSALMEALPVGGPERAQLKQALRDAAKIIARVHTALIQQVSDQRVREVLEGIKNEMHSASIEEEDFTWFEPDVFNIIDQTLADYLSHKEPTNGS